MAMAASARRFLALVLVVPGFRNAAQASGAPASCANGGNTLLMLRQSVTKTAPATPAKVWEAVDGTPGSHACRGNSPTDNNRSYYEVKGGVESLEACQHLCEEHGSCKGIEYNPNGRCEVWTRMEGIAATSMPPAAWGTFSCLRFGWPISTLAPADGQDRACRGDTATDNSASYYELHEVTHLEGCKALCAAAPACFGLEYGGGRRCEIWTRPILATAAVPRSQCLRFGAAPEPAVLASYHPLSGECTDDSLAAVAALEGSDEVPI